MSVYVCVCTFVRQHLGNCLYKEKHIERCCKGAFPVYWNCSQNTTTNTHKQTNNVLNPDLLLWQCKRKIKHNCRQLPNPHWYVDCRPIQGRLLQQQGLWLQLYHHKANNTQLFTVKGSTHKEPPVMDARLGVQNITSQPIEVQRLLKRWMTCSGWEMCSDSVGFRTSNKAVIWSDALQEIGQQSCLNLECSGMATIG